MCCTSFIFLLMWTGMFLARIDFAVAQNECNSNSDCTSSGDVCCAGNYHLDDRTCRSDSCSGQYCSTDGDCGGKGECCKFNKCNTYNCTECDQNTDCAASEYCCKQRSNADLNVCRRSCTGEPCSSDSDCGGPRAECNWKNECAESKPFKYTTAVIVIGSIFGLVVICLFVRFVMVYGCQRQAPRPLQQTQSTTAIISYRKNNNRATLHQPPPQFNQGRNFAQPQRYIPPPLHQQTSPPPQHYTFPPPQHQTFPLPQHYTSPPPQHHITSPSKPPAYP